MGIGWQRAGCPRDDASPWSQRGAALVFGVAAPWPVPTVALPRRTGCARLTALVSRGHGSRSPRI